MYINLVSSFPWFRGSQCCCLTTELNLCCGDRCCWEVKQKFASVVNLSAVLWSLLSQCLIKLHTRSKQMKEKCCSSQIMFKVTISSQVKSTWGNQFTAEAETLSIILHYVKALLQPIQYRRTRAVWRSRLYLVRAMGQAQFQSRFFNLKPELYSLSAVTLFWEWRLVVLHTEQKSLTKCLDVVD